MTTVWTVQMALGARRRSASLLYKTIGGPSALAPPVLVELAHAVEDPFQALQIRSRSCHWR